MMLILLKMKSFIGEKTNLVIFLKGLAIQEHLIKNLKKQFAIMIGVEKVNMVSIIIMEHANILN